MPHRFIRSMGALTLFATFCMLPHAGALSNVSAWAEKDIAAAQMAGLVPESLQTLNARGEVTRAEFCSIALNVYKTISGKTVFASGRHPFRDCDDPNVTAAFELGIVSGRGNGIFDPDASIERQDLCVMLHNIIDATKIDAAGIVGEACIEDYTDISHISDYALDAVVTMVDYAVVSGLPAPDGSNILSPDGTATREQALIMAERFCNVFAADEPAGNMPAPDAGNSTDAPHDLWQQSNLTVPLTDEQKMTLVYGPGGEQYQSAEQAEANMIEIAVPVWRLQEDGSKTSDTAYLVVNRALAPIYATIFEEIYNGAERFPIKNVGCYSWRTGEHSQGTAVDINWEENMEATINDDGTLTPTTGSHWSPGIDPYSIPEGGDVYNAFTKYGFSWGGNAWSVKRDYMHFSYFGR